MNFHGTKPAKPGLVRVAAHASPATPAGRGIAIEVEVWALPQKNAGAFLAKVPPPLCLGNILLESGESVKGFLCEPFALANAEDISEHGGWLRYLSAQKAAV